MTKLTDQKIAGLLASARSFIALICIILSESTSLLLAYQNLPIVFQFFFDKIRQKYKNFKLFIDVDDYDIVCGFIYIYVIWVYAVGVDEDRRNTKACLFYNGFTIGRRYNYLCATIKLSTYQITDFSQLFDHHK